MWQVFISPSIDVAGDAAVEAYGGAGDLAPGASHFENSRWRSRHLKIVRGAKQACVMTDRLSPEERSSHMRRIRGRDTRPETRVRRALYDLGCRYRLHRRDLPGTPDIVLPKRRLAIFVHGCFWHQHLGCRLARLPKTRPEYWLPKFHRNAERDKKVVAALTEMGWRPVIVWECETTNAKVLVDRLTDLLS